MRVQRTGMVLRAAMVLAVLSVLCSCGRESFSLEELDYVTVEHIQSAEHREHFPAIQLDLPEGFRFADLELVEGDVLDRRDSWARGEVGDYGIGGFNWPEKEVAMWVTVRAKAAKDEIESTDRKPDFAEKSVADPEWLVMHPIVEDRVVEFGNFSGRAIYSAMEDESRQRLQSKINSWLTPRELRELFDCCSGIEAESVVLAASNDTHNIVIIANVFGMKNYFPEILDIVLRVAESIRIKE